MIDTEAPQARILKRTIRSIVPIVSLLAVAISAHANGLSRVSERSAQMAGRLVLCTDWPEFSAERFQGFLSQTDIAASGPEIVAGPSGLKNDGRFSVLLIASTGALSVNVLSCAEKSLDAPEDPIWEQLKAATTGFMALPDMTGVPLPPGITFGPVRERRSYFTVDDQWIVILNQSILAPGQRVNAAMFGSFGLDASVCNNNDFCFADY